jgi:hypothetical protein
MNPNSITYKTNPDNQYGQCYDCGLNSSQHPDKCDDERVWDVVIEDLRPINYLINQEVRREKKRDPRPVVPERVIPCEGKSVPLPDSVNAILGEDEKIADILFNHNVEGLTQGEDFTVQYEIDELENLMTFCYIFPRDQPATTAKVTVQTPDALFGARPTSVSADTFGDDRRALQMVHNQNAPVIKAFEVEFAIEGRRTPSDAAINTFKSFGIIFLIGLMGAIAFGLFVTVLKLTFMPRLNIS